MVAVLFGLGLLFLMALGSGIASRVIEVYLGLSIAVCLVGACLWLYVKITELYREEARKKEQAPRQKAHDAGLKAQEARQLLQQRFAEIALQQAARQAAQEQQRPQATFWQCLDGPTFEREVAKLFEQAGYRAELTP